MQYGFRKYLLIFDSTRLWHYLFCYVILLHVCLFLAGLLQKLWMNFCKIWTVVFLSLHYGKNCWHFSMVSRIGVLCPLFYCFQHCCDQQKWNCWKYLCDFKVVCGFCRWLCWVRQRFPCYWWLWHQACSHASVCTTDAQHGVDVWWSCCDRFHRTRSNPPTCMSV